MSTRSTTQLTWTWLCLTFFDIYCGFVYMDIVQNLRWEGGLPQNVNKKNPWKMILLKYTRMQKKHSNFFVFSNSGRWSSQLGQNPSFCQFFLRPPSSKYNFNNEGKLRPNEHRDKPSRRPTYWSSIENEKTCASFLERKEKGKYYVSCGEFVPCILLFASSWMTSILMFLILHIFHFAYFQSGPANLWTENCWMELNSACLLQSHWDDMHNICVRNSSASKLEMPLMFADVCTCTVNSAQCALCSVSDMCTVQCVVCSHFAGQVSQGYKGNNFNSAKDTKEASSKSTCMQCMWSHKLISGCIAPG